jgi:hypothetical protein
MKRRQLTVASKIRPGDLVRLGGAGEFQRVARVTGSPGRRSPSKPPLLRLFLESSDGYVTVRTDAAVQTLR